MVSLTCETMREGGVTLVTARVANPDRRRRIRLRHDAEGAVWPPRTEGVPADGWDGATFECVLDAGETRAVGYATPARVEDPLVVAETEAVDPPSGFESDDAAPDVTTDPAGVIRALGTPVPPRDAVPDPKPTSDSEPVSNPEPAYGPEPASGTDLEDGHDPESDAVPDPAAVDAWLDAVETQVAAVEELSDSPSVAAATPTVGRLGGLAGVRDAVTDLETETDRLRRVAERATALANRVEAADPPIETLERLT